MLSLTYRWLGDGELEAYKSDHETYSRKMSAPGFPYVSFYKRTQFCSGSKYSPATLLIARDTTATGWWYSESSRTFIKVLGYGKWTRTPRKSAVFFSFIVACRDPCISKSDLQYKEDFRRRGLLQKTRWLSLRRRSSLRRRTTADKCIPKTWFKAHGVTMA